MKQPEPAALYDAAERWIDCGLRRDDSLFTSGVPIWSAASAEELYAHYNLQLDTSSGDNFETKLKRQLESVTPGCYQLAAEALYVMNIIPGDITGKAKRAGIEKVLEWLPSPVSIPDDLAAVLDHGLVGGGLAFKTLKWAQFATLIDFTRTWKGASEAERASMLADPWAFRDFVWQLDVTTGKAMRETLLHLVFPETFEDIVSANHKKAIASAFSQYVKEPSANVDRQLLEIRNGLAAGRESWFSFYHPDLKHQWQTDADARSRWDAMIHWASRFAESVDLERTERAYKLEAGQRLAAVRAHLKSGDPEWRPMLVATITKLGNLVHHIQAARFADWIESDPDASERALHAMWLESTEPISRLLPLVAASKEHDFDFLSVASVLMMAIDAREFPPIRATASDKALELVGGGKASAWRGEANRFRYVLSFLDRFREEADQRGLPARDRLDAQTLLWAATQYDAPAEWSDEEREALASWREGSLPPMPRPGPVKREPQPQPGPGTHPLAKSLYVPAEFIDDVLRLLHQRGQIILYGPPGSGKTFIARALARHVAEDRFDVVQFHPSYSYEDFVQGYRPVLVGDALTYRLTAGPLVRAAQAAAADPRPRVLLIDEINRGNLPKILGELLYLLEYRDDAVQLMYDEYGSDPFRLPENLLVIGTMNTADRSIGLIDAALRRRFHFVPLFPSRYPLESTLRDWLAENRPDMRHVAGIVDALNAKLIDRLGPHLQVGHSHFFRDDLSATVLEEIWRHDILPFLQDQLYGHEDELAEFDLSRFIEESGADATADGMADDDSASDG